MESIFGIPFSNIVGVLLSGGAGAMTWVLDRSFHCDADSFTFSVKVEGETARIAGPLTSVIAVVSA